MIPQTETKTSRSHQLTAFHAFQVRILSDAGDYGIDRNENCQQPCEGGLYRDQDNAGDSFGGL